MARHRKKQKDYETKLTADAERCTMDSKPFVDKGMAQADMDAELKTHLQALSAKLDEYSDGQRRLQQQMDGLSDNIVSAALNAWDGS